MRTAIAAGVLAAGLLAQFAPWPLRTVYAIYLLVPVIGVALLARWVGHLWADVVFAAISAALAFLALAVGLRQIRRSV